MPKIDIPVTIAIAVWEPIGGVMEQQRAGRERLTSEGKRHPTEKAASIVIETLRNISRKRGKYADNLNTAGAVYLLTGLMTEADSRRGSAERAWALIQAPLEGGGVCPTTEAETFGVAFARLLTNETLFHQAREIWVAGNQGLATIEFSDGHVSRFKAEGDFEPDRAIVRARSLEVAKLRTVFDALAEPKRAE